VRSPYCSATASAALSGWATIPPRTVGTWCAWLALAAVASAGDDDKFAFADVSAINDPALVAATVADAIDLSGGGGQDPHASLVAALADRPILLVVDNCEHLLEALSELVDDLLSRCPAVRVLATSREPLGVTGSRSCG
jgi:predicted ATPase